MSQKREKKEKKRGEKRVREKWSLSACMVVETGKVLYNSTMKPGLEGHWERMEERWVKRGKETEKCECGDFCTRNNTYARLGLTREQLGISPKATGSQELAECRGRGWLDRCTDHSESQGWELGFYPLSS